MRAFYRTFKKKGPFERRKKNRPTHFFELGRQQQAGAAPRGEAARGEEGEGEGKGGGAKLVVRREREEKSATSGHSIDRAHSQVDHHGQLTLLNGLLPRAREGGADWRRI